LLAFGFIVDTSFGFNRGNPHRSVRYQSPVLQSIERISTDACTYATSEINYNINSLVACMRVSVEVLKPISRLSVCRSQDLGFRTR
jgi:hypothetical protein